MKELATLRRKYPQYDHIEDRELLGRIGTKYPKAYGNLLSKFDSEQEEMQRAGEVRLPQSPIGNVIGSAKRMGSLVAKGLTEDVPFVRNAMPDQIMQIEPETSPFKSKGTGQVMEENIPDLAKLLRDIALWETGAQATRAIPALKGGATILKRTLPSIAGGMVAGGMTAGSEDPNAIVGHAAAGGAAAGTIHLGIEGIGAGTKAAGDFAKKLIKSKGGQKILGELNGIRWRVARAMGKNVPAEVVPFDYALAIKEGRMTLRQASDLSLKFRNKMARMEGAGGNSEAFLKERADILKKQGFNPNNVENLPQQEPVDISLPEPGKKAPAVAMPKVMPVEPAIAAKPEKLPPHLQDVVDKQKGIKTQDVTPEGYGPEAPTEEPIKGDVELNDKIKKILEEEDANEKSKAIMDQVKKELAEKEKNAPRVMHETLLRRLKQEYEAGRITKETYETQVKKQEDWWKSYVEETTVKPPASTSDLEAEAKKYDKAEDFVASKKLLYHGTPDARQLDEFKTPKERFAGGEDKDKAFYFTDNMTVAKSYADDTRAFDYQGAEPKILEQYVNINNPLVVDAKGQIWRRAEISVGGETIKGTRALVKYAKENGYNGIVIKNVVDMYNTPSKVTKQHLGTSYVAFDSSQVKTKQQLTDIYNKAHAKPVKPEVKPVKPKPDVIEKPTQSLAIAKDSPLIAFRVSKIVGNKLIKGNDVYVMDDGKIIDLDASQTIGAGKEYPMSNFYTHEPEQYSKMINERNRVEKAKEKEAARLKPKDPERQAKEDKFKADLKENAEKLAVVNSEKTAAAKKKTFNLLVSGAVDAPEKDIIQYVKKYNPTKTWDTRLAFASPKNGEYVTDGRYLIVDKKIAEEIRLSYYKQMAKDELKQIKKRSDATPQDIYDLEKTWSDPKNLVKKFGIDEIGDAQPPAYDKILEQVDKKGDILTYQATVKFSDGGVKMIYTTGNDQVGINAELVKMIKGYFPEATFEWVGENKPIKFWENGKLKGVVMPMNITEDQALPPVDYGVEKKTSKLLSRKEMDDVLAKNRAEEIKKPSGNATTSVPSMESKAVMEGAETAEAPIKLTHIEQIKKIDMPELVQIAKEFLGEMPRIVKRTGNALGRFSYLANKLTGKGVPGSESIKIVARAFKDEKDAAAILAHEIGHLIDYLPDKTMKRGNSIGRMISSVSQYMKSTFSESGPADLNKIRRQAVKEFKSIYEVDKVTEAGEEWSKYWKEYKESALKRGGFISNDVLANELKDLTTTWSPFEPSKATPDYLAYRYSAKELYAEFMSVLLNAPAMAKEIAPTAYRMFFEHLDKKPEVKGDYLAVQAMLNGDKSAIYKMREKNLRSMFDRAESEVKAIKMRGLQARKSVFDMLKYYFIDKNHFILKGRNTAAKGRVINPENDPKYLLEEQNYIGAVVKSHLEELNPIYMEMLEKGIEQEVGMQLYLERVASGDRQELGNPLGYQPSSAKEQLAHFKESNPEKFKDVERATEEIRKWFNGLNKLLEEDILSEKQIELVSGNEKYAPFRVTKYLKDYVSAGIAPQMGTFNEIGSPFNAIVLKGMSMIRAYENNRIKKRVGNFISSNSDYFGKVEKAKITAYPGVFKVRPHPDSFMKPIVWRENGKWKGIYVDKYIADSFDQDSTGMIAMVGDVLNKVLLNNMFRNLYITFNVGFQSFNLVRDFMRYWKNVPGMTVAKALKSYAKAYPHAIKRVKGEFDPLISEMERNKSLTITFNDLIKGEDTEDKEIMALMKNFGLIDNKKHKGIMKGIMGLLDAIKFSGDVIETIPKVAGYQETKDLSPKERAYVVRNFVGTPQWKRGGKLKPIYNNVFLFSNIIKEAIRGTYEVAFQNPKTRGGWWYKTAKANLLPKFLMFLASSGLFGATVKDMMDSATEYDKTNYTIIPIPGAKVNGKQAYLRIPQDEEGRIFSGMMWKILNSTQGKTDWESSMQEILSFTGEQLPFAGLAPLLGIGGVWKDYTQGKNPRDNFRGSDILQRQEMEAGGADALIPMLKWSLNQTGHFRFNLHDRYDAATFLEKAVQLTPVVNRYVRITNWGKAESLYQELDKERKTKARTDLEQQRLAIKAMEEKTNPGELKDRIPENKRKDFSKKVVREKYLAETNDVTAKVMKSAQSNAQKLKILSKAYKAGYVKKDDLRDYILKMVEIKILSAKFVKAISENEKANEDIRQAALKAHNTLDDE